MTDAAKKCAECGEPFGEGTTQSALSHTINCFNLPNTSAKDILAMIADRHDEWADRIRKNLTE